MVTVTLFRSTSLERIFLNDMRTKNRSLTLLNLKHFILAQYASKLNESMSYRFSDNFPLNMYMFETLSDIMVQTKSSFMSNFYPKRKKFSVEKSTRSSQENGRYYLKPSV